MFNAGEKIIYGVNGVCTIADIEKKNFTGTEELYYVLKGDNSHQVIYIPVNNTSLTSKMRRVLTKEDALSFIDAMPSIACAEWPEENRRRAEHFKKILSDGTRDEIWGVVKSVDKKRSDMLENGKKLYLSDENIYKRAQKLIYDELAYALDKSFEELESLIYSPIG